MRNTLSGFVLHVLLLLDENGVRLFPASYFSSKSGLGMARICSLAGHFLVGLGIGDSRISSNFAMLTI